MRYDNYVCNKCGTKYPDTWGDAVCCDELCVKDWTAINPNIVARETMFRSCDFDGQGRMLRARVKDSPRCKEILLNPERTQIPKEQVDVLADKFIKDGDSSGLRREILAADARASGKDDAYTGRT
jgi:hypothetical protein